MVDDLPPDVDDVPPEWVERSDDYNVFEERQLDADRDAGEYLPAEPAPSVPFLIAEIKPAAAYVINAIAVLEAYPIATASPQERADLLELREVLEALSQTVRIRLQAIDLAFKRGMEELAAREIPVAGWGPVRYTPDEGEWEVHADELLREFRALVKEGTLTNEDIEKAFTQVVTIKVDNRVLNGLNKRGTAVQEAIERNRTKRAPRPLQGRLSLPKRKEAARAED